jgi:hypothetical protein
MVPTCLSCNDCSGHEDPRQTMTYLHLSTRSLCVALNPLDTIRLAGDESLAES